MNRVSINPKRFRHVVLPVLIVVMLLMSFAVMQQPAQALPAGFKIIGYMPSWAGSVSNTQFSKLTHMNYAFILPNGDGSLQALDNPSKLQSLVSSGHANGVKILISVGGWNDGNDSGFETLAASSTSRTNFVNNLVNLVNQYGLDGVDIDWEYPDPGTSGDHYTLMMSQLSDAMHSRGKLLTAAVVSNGGTGDGVQSTVFGKVDFLNIMAYDGDNGAGHSPYQLAVDSLNYWRGRGLPASKAVLGVPFYAHPSWATYSDLLAAGCSPDSDTCTYQGATNYYNGRPTMRKKTDLAMQQGGGIMYWEDSQDVTDSRSLLSAIYAEANSGTTPTNTPIPNGNGNPYGGTAVSLPGTIQAENFNTGGEGVAYHDADTANQGSQYRTGEGVDIEATTDTNAGYNVGWTAAGEWLKYTVNVTASGTYNIAFRVASAQTGGTFHLEVDGANVSGTLTVPNTGGWQTWTTINKTGVSLSAGTRIFRLVTDSAGGNYNWIAVTSGITVTNTPKPTATFAPPTNTPIPGTATKVPPTATQSTTTPAWDGNSHPYNVGDLVSYQGHIYRCQQAHTSLPTWDPVSAPALWAFVS